MCAFSVLSPLLWELSLTGTEQFCESQSSHDLQIKHRLSINYLYQLLKRYELRVFHLEEPDLVYNSGQSTAELLPYLKQQQRLKTLALINPRCDPGLASISIG